MIKSKVFASLVFIVLGFSLSAHSQDKGGTADATNPYKDTASVEAYLKSSGIEPATINWVQSILCVQD